MSPDRFESWKIINQLFRENPRKGLQRCPLRASQYQDRKLQVAMSNLLKKVDSTSEYVRVQSPLTNALSEIIVASVCFLSKNLHHLRNSCIEIFPDRSTSTARKPDQSLWYRKKASVSNGTHTTRGECGTKLTWDRHPAVVVGPDLASWKTRLSRRC